MEPTKRGRKRVGSFLWKLEVEGRRNEGGRGGSRIGQGGSRQ